MSLGRRVGRQRASRGLRKDRLRRVHVSVAGLYAARADPLAAGHGADRRRPLLEHQRVISRAATEVTTCRSCGGRKLPEVLSLGSTPIANALVDPNDAPESDPAFPLDVVFC